MGDGKDSVEGAGREGKAPWSPPALKAKVEGSGVLTGLAKMGVMAAVEGPPFLLLGEGWVPPVCLASCLQGSPPGQGNQGREVG